MKKILFVIAAITMIACGTKKEQSVADVIATNNIKEIKAKRNALVSQVKELEIAISKLDTVKKTILVSTMLATTTDFYHYVEIQGNVETKQNLILYPEINGALKSILVKEGQRVNKGQTIAIIDDSGLKDQLAQLDADAELAKTTFERQERLWNQKIGSEIQFLQAKTAYAAKSKAVDNLKAQIDKTYLKAPYSGIVDDIITEEGSYVMPGQSPIVRLVNLSDMTISAEVPETFISNVKKGKKVDIYIPVLDASAETTITQAGNFINPNNRKFKVEMNVPNSIEAKPNMSVRLNINDYHNEAAILIPQSIISENEKNEEYIFTAVKKGDKYVAHKTFVELGRTNKNDIEVVSGLAPKSLIIVEGARSVKEGQEVTILN
ncbi:efflux RND transporter periplasmic adaptor subunit [Wenyingzhuangia marina]|uniref:RND family efflux transporter, MFP subunit n=1 Tax=Wenyingzhuangia marina TaxID=1195760 RepID=A0A1M5WV64_9FLAO|nr:efflux RND transporter periplasmic adaptor subunit [Wenyingzhuangia marina]GGF82390.1 RND transporter [Wenyingzhuangia marina]SHH91505.1 RND family efflux transporter, MFP subunit [Wenyingzhuangia marina]